MKTKKSNLKSLKLKSFVTEFEAKEVDVIKGEWPKTGYSK